LPEVLRCGTRYRRFRDHFSQVIVTSCSGLGQFDEWTDIHVFVALLRIGVFGEVERGGLNFNTTKTSSKHRRSVEDDFDVSVGCVVPHREPKRGPFRPYITASGLPRGSNGFRPTYHRRFSGTVVDAPFVAIRRTSRPGTGRAIATVIRSKGAVAVENHLIVARPKSGLLGDCIRLAGYLACRDADDALNSSMRCRHLTTKSIRELRWR